MLVCGIVLLAIGIGALLDLSIWPIVLIALGGALLMSVLTGARRRHPHWFYTCCSRNPLGSSKRERRTATESDRPRSETP